MYEKIFEEMRMPFQSDVLATVAVADAKIDPKKARRCSELVLHPNALPFRCPLIFSYY